MEVAVHSIELYTFIEENGFCEVYDLFQSDPDVLRVNNSELSFMEADFNESTPFVIYSDSKYNVTESRIKAMLQRFYVSCGAVYTMIIKLHMDVTHMFFISLHS